MPITPELEAVLDHLKAAEAQVNFLRENTAAPAAPVAVMGIGRKVEVATTEIEKVIKAHGPTRAAIITNGEATTIDLAA